MVDMLKDIREADVVITISRRDGMKAIKNRTGEHDKKLSLPDVLELILPYQDSYLHSVLDKWIQKLKIYGTFS